MSTPAAWRRFECEVRGALLAISALFVSLVYALPYYQMNDYYPLDDKPYVYRWLSLWLISLLERAGFEYEFAAMLIIAVGGAAFVFSVIYMLLTALESTRLEETALVLLVIFIALFQRYLKPYDLPTAAFFTLALTLMARQKFSAYVLIFFLTSANRETTILLLPVFMVYFWDRLAPRKYWLLVTAQAVTFVTVQAAIRYVYRDAPGSSVWISPAQNIAAHWDQPVASLLSLAVSGLVLWLVFNQWHQKPLFLRTAFVILTPALFLLYIIAGQAFEFRVFAEVYSVTALLALPSKVL